MANLAVAEAERALATARAEAQRQERLDARDRVIELAAEGARLTTELEPFRLQIKTALAERLRLHGELVRARNMIGLYGAELDPLSFPTENDERERLKQLAVWKARQKDLLAAHERNEKLLAFDVRRRAIGLAAQLGRVELEIKNWATISEGLRPGQITGELTTTEDFLGHSDRRFD